MTPSRKNGGHVTVKVPLVKEEDFGSVDEMPKRHPLTWILKLTALYFGEKRECGFWYIFGLLRALVICGVCK